MLSIHYYAPEKTTFLRYIMLQLFCVYNLRHMQCYFPRQAFCTFTLVLFESMCAVPSVAVFCSCLMSCFPGNLFRYFLNDVQMVQVAAVVTGTFLFLHSTCGVFYCKAVYLKRVSASFFITFISPENAVSINIYDTFSLSRITMTIILLRTLLSVFTYCLNNMTTLFSWPVSTDLGICSYQCS